MVLTSLLGSTLLRTKKLHLPQTFRRYKSLTQAIERGRQGGPDRPSRPRTRTSPDDVGDRPLKNRRERRLERFGPPSKKPKNKSDTLGTNREERPPRDRDEEAFTPRSSRFGRVGPPRPRGFAPSRFQDDQEDRPSRDRDELPRRREDRFASPPERPASRVDRFNGERRQSSDRYEGRKPSPYSTEDKQPRRERYEGDERPQRRARQFESRDRKPFETRDRKPFASQDRTSFETRDRKPFDRGNRYDGPPSRLPDRSFATGYRREEVRHESRPKRPERSFKNRDDSSSYTRERTGREQTERPYSRDFVQKQTEAPSRTTANVNTPRSSVREPESLPYTTAASEFIYGYSSVLAAIKANRRKLYTLYIHSRGANRDGLLARIRALKLFPITQEVGDEYLRAMDKASSGRPHNGVILESSPLPVPPITELKTVSIDDESFSVAVDSQSGEDALVNGKQELYSYKAAGWRHPLILYVDGVLDEGNLGAIARSAYVLGVDAIVTPTRQVAPWSHIALKASAGAAEAVPIFKVGEPTDFLGKSSRAGWRIYASDTVPTTPSTAPEVQEDATSDIVYTFARSTKRLPADHCPVADHPTILMMGAEGTGLRGSLLNLAHYNVGIRHGRDVDEIGVDSLNVSVAASLLCYEMLRKPKSKPAPKAEEALF